MGVYFLFDGVFSKLCNYFPKGNHEERVQYCAKTQGRGCSDIVSDFLSVAVLRYCTRGKVQPSRPATIILYLSILCRNGTINITCLQDADHRAPGGAIDKD